MPVEVLVQSACRELRRALLHPRKLCSPDRSRDQRPRVATYRTSC
jgi:hypothetical protein